MSLASALVELRSVCFGYANRPVFLGPVSWTIERGQSWAIVGPNGAGKSTLMRLVAGLLTPRDGAVNFQGRSLLSLPLRQRARRISFLPQRPPETIDFAVRDIVLMGRYPHRSMGLFESAEDLCIAKDAMQRTGVMDFADRVIDTLSGGEAQRVHLAAALAQQPDLFLLDEPTAFLDIKHQLGVFDILRSLIRPEGPAVVTVMHDVNLAAMFCSHILLLHDGKPVVAGTPQEVLTADRLRTVYEVELAALPLPQPPHQWLVPIRGTEVSRAWSPA